MKPPPATRKDAAAPQRSKASAAKPDPMPDVSDYELLLMHQKGRGDAFEVLVLRHKNIMYNFIYRMVGDAETADDLFQETWLKVLRNAHTYTPKAKFTTWALQIARNATLDHFKRSNLRRHASLDDDSGGDETSLKQLLAGSGPTPDDALLSGEVLECVKHAIQRLPDNQREALVMRMYHELPYDEIGDLMGAPEGTVKYWVHEAVKALAEHLERKGLR